MSDITVGSVAVDIVPSIQGFKESLKSKLAGLKVDIGINADTTEMRAQLDEATRSRTATINADADTGAAEAELDAVARPRSASIEADGRGVSAMVAGVLALGPALVPIVAAVAGLTAALGLPLAAAGGGLTIFGLIGGAAIAKTNKVAKQIAELKKRADSLSDPKAAAAAAAQAKALEASLTGPQRAFLAARGAVSEAFNTLLKTSGDDLFKPINQGLRTLADIMPSLAPVIRSVSGALSGLLQSIGQSAKSGGLKSFLDFLGRASGPAIAAFGDVLGNIAVGMGGLLSAFAPVAASLTSKLVGLSDSFASLGQNAGSNKGLQSFIGYVQQVGPQVADTLGSLVGAIVHISVALAPIGGLVLGGIKLLSDVVSAIPVPVLTVLAAVIITIVAGLKLWAIAQAILNAVMDANPIALVVLAIAGLVAGLILAYKHSETFRKIVDGAFRAVGAAIDFAKDHWKLLLVLITGPFGLAILGVISHFKAVKAVVTTVFKFIVDAFLTVVGALVNGAAKAFGWVPGIGGKLKAAAQHFNEFRDSVNASLSGINDKTVKINVVPKGIAAPRQHVLSTLGIPEGAGATGAIVRRPTIALIGEAGPEKLTPLNQTEGNSPLPGVNSSKPVRLVLLLDDGTQLGGWVDQRADARIGAQRGIDSMTGRAG